MFVFLYLMLTSSWITTLDSRATVCCSAPLGPLRQQDCSKSTPFTSQHVLLLPVIYSCQGAETRRESLKLPYSESWQSEQTRLTVPKPVFHLLSNQKILWGERGRFWNSGQVASKYPRLAMPVLIPHALLLPWMSGLRHFLKHWVSQPCTPLGPGRG